MALGGVGVQLLVQNGLEQRFKGRVRAFHPQRKGADTFDERAQLCVGRRPTVGAQARCRSEPGGRPSTMKISHFECDLEMLTSDNKSASCPCASDHATAQSALTVPKM